MSTAELPDLVDFSYQRPDPTQLRDLGLDAASYSGSARVPAAWLAELTSYGRRMLMIQETYSTRSQEGFSAGQADCLFAEARSDEIGYSADLPIAVVVSDGNYADSWDCSEYARGWISVARRKFFPYGALGVISSFHAAARASGSVLWIDGEWVPITWGSGRLIQQLVTEPPIPGTDMNTVVGDWTGGGVTPAVPTAEDSVLYKTTDNGVDTWYREASGVLIKLSKELAAAYYPGVVSGKIAVVELGGTLGAVAFTAETVDTLRRVGVACPEGGGTGGGGATPEQVQAATAAADAMATAATALAAAAADLRAAFS